MEHLFSCFRIGNRQRFNVFLSKLLANWPSSDEWNICFRVFNLEAYLKCRHSFCILFFCQYSTRLDFWIVLIGFLHKKIKTYFSSHKLTKRNLEICHFYSFQINEFVGPKKSASHCWTCLVIAFRVAGNRKQRLILLTFYKFLLKYVLLFYPAYFVIFTHVISLWSISFDYN